jgi:UDP-N-acetylglucosamine 2-epimerase (non-hydrolysing)
MAPQKILSVVGTRPNFMKIAPIAARLAERPDEFEHVLVHTGQHYDEAMSKIFFEQLGVGDPDHMLEVGSGTNTWQTARVMERLEPVLLEERPDVVLVPGDVTSTLAASLCAAQLRIPLGHVEAGLRSFDPTMPEELNRTLSDQVSDHLFIHSPEARDNLLREGVAEERIHDVGNTMIDMLVAMRGPIEELDVPSAHGVERGKYLVVTLHRPALVDGPLLGQAMARLEELARELTVIFPIHPRTRKMLGQASAGSDGLRLVDPLGYTEFLGLVAGSAGVLTDSGGIQEETTFLGIPCFTLRDNTERPVTCEIGTNTLLGLAPERIAEIPDLLERAAGATPEQPQLWDGHAAERIVDVLAGSAAPGDDGHRAAAARRGGQRLQA